MICYRNDSSRHGVAVKHHWFDFSLYAAGIRTFRTSIMFMATSTVFSLQVDKCHDRLACTRLSCTP